MGQVAKSRFREDVAAAIEKRLRLRKAARADGAAGRPASDEELTDTEIAIDAAILDERAPLLAERGREASNLEARLRRVNAAEENFALDVETARLALARIESRVGAEYRALRARADAERRDVDRFRAVEERTMGPKLPGSSIYYVGVLLVMMLVDAVASAVIFAETAEGGLIYAYLFGLIVSALNAGMGFLGGFFGVRYTRHKRAPMAALGWSALAASAAASFGFNAYMTWWRASAKAPPGDATPLLGLMFGDAQSLMLMLLGAFVFVVALYEGATRFGELYPDYGRFERHAREAEEDVRDLRDEVLAEMEAVLDTARDAIFDRLETRRKELAALHADYDAAADRVLDIEAALRRVDEASAHLHGLYRRENREARKDPGPRRFDRETPQTALADILAEAGRLRRAADQALASAEARAGQELASLGQALDAALARLDGAA